MGPGGIFADILAGSRGAKSPVTVTAATDVTLLLIPYKSLLRPGVPLDAAHAVSYTHLDVYKRQHYTLFTYYHSRTIQHYLLAYSQMCIRDRALREGTLAEYHFQDYLPAGGLRQYDSDTVIRVIPYVQSIPISRDVYKRQLIHIAHERKRAVGV